MSLNQQAHNMSDQQPRYHMMRVALTLLQKPLVELDEQEHKQVEQQAYRELAIEQKALSSKEASSVIIPQKLVDDSLAEIIARYEDEESFWKALDDNGLDREQLLASIERDLRVQAVIERITASGWQVTDEDVEIFYREHRERFQVPETRTLRHILITINDQYVENSREQAGLRIEEIRRRVCKKPKRFEEQAQKNSECPTAMHGGLLGRMPRGQLYPELEAVAFAMQQGEISEPVESELGLHILYCEEIHKAGIVPFHEVRQKLKDQLQQRYDRIWLRNWLKNT